VREVSEETALSKNTNCLAGMRCPKCGALEPYSIMVTRWLTVFDDGTEFHEDGRWNEDSECECLSCRYSGKVRDFNTQERL
jgi:hypothetical protein